MRKRNFYALSLLSCVLAMPACANWQYPGTYVGDGWYEDDGTRFIISARGGASFGMGKIQNDVGAIVTGYYVSPDYNEIATQGYCEATGNCSGWIYAGYGELSQVDTAKDLESFSFAAGASIGWTIPNHPQWRIEAGWDYISKSDYNASPMFEGDLLLQGGATSEPIIANVRSGSVNSQISTDIISAMVFYDFFEGLQKPIRTFIPYVGFGVGYADTKTVLNLSDPYGDIAYQLELMQYGEVVTVDGINMVEFYRSERNTTNVAGLLSVGFSYGITENMFFDLGARVAYLPKVKWGLTNEDDTRHREFFSAENLIYANIMAGIRFEF